MVCFLKKQFNTTTKLFLLNVTKITFFNVKRNLSTIFHYICMKSYEN